MSDSYRVRELGDHRQRLVLVRALTPRMTGLVFEPVGHLQRWRMRIEKERCDVYTNKTENKRELGFRRWTAAMKHI